jgi:hypothetical protein
MSFTRTFLRNPDENAKVLSRCVHNQSDHGSGCWWCCKSFIEYLNALQPVSQKVPSPARMLAPMKRDPFPIVPLYLNLLASRSDSSKQRMSSSRTAEDKMSALLPVWYILNDEVCAATANLQQRDFVPGPLTLRMMLRVVSSMNSTLTCVTPPREPVKVRSSSR